MSIELPRCMVWLLGRGQPAPASANYPADVERAVYAEQARFLDASGVTAETALAAAQGIEASLREQLARLASAVAPRSAPRFDSEADAELASVLEGLEREPHAARLGYRVTRPRPTLGRSELHGWVDDDESLRAASHRLARASQLKPGVIELGRLLQHVAARGGRSEYHTATIGDGNDRRLFVDLALLHAEELAHLAQHLRRYAGLDGAHTNVSRWARESGQPWRIDLEADVLAFLEESYGPLRPYWRERYRSRRNVPHRRD